MFDPFAPFRLTGRTALVTGARREIGRAIALGLAGAGARLAIHHAGTSEERSDAADVVREIQVMGGEATAFGQDFTHDDAGRHLAAAVIQINKRCDNPTTGTVGTIYATAYLVIGEPLISYQDLPNQADFNTFPFVAVELTETKIPVRTDVGQAAGWVWDPAGNNPYVGAIGTDHKGRAIKFVTPLVFAPGNPSPTTSSGCQPRCEARRRQFSPKMSKKPSAPPRATRECLAGCASWASVHC